MVQTNRARGFTLMELMIVLAIVAGVAVLAMPYIGNRNNQTKSFLRQMVVLSRELHTKAKLQGAVFRLVIDLKQPSISGEGSKQVYWVEKSYKKIVMKKSEEEDALKAARDQKPGEKIEDPRGFEMDTSVIKQPRELPPGLKFDRVELTRVKDPITEGKAFIHYLPQGLADEAAIHIKGEGKQAWTIAVHPLTGKAELITRSMTLKQMRNE